MIRFIHCKWKQHNIHCFTDWITPNLWFPCIDKVYCFTSLGSARRLCRRLTIVTRIYENRKRSTSVSLSVSRSVVWEFVIEVPSFSPVLKGLKEDKVPLSERTIWRESLVTGLSPVNGKSFCFSPFPLVLIIVTVTDQYRVRDPDLWVIEIYVTEGGV